MITKLKAHLKFIAALLIVGMPLLFAQPALAYNACGVGPTSYKPSIDLGCTGQGTGIMDLLFALVRFLSIGVGLVIVGSMIYAGLQYIGSRGDPNANAQAIKRIQANVIALLIFVFAFAIVNYIVPGQLLK